MEWIEIVVHTTTAGSDPVSEILMEAGASGIAEINIPAERFKVVNDKGEKVDPEGSVTVYAGFGQPDSLTERLTGKKAVTFTV